MCAQRHPSRPGDRRRRLWHLHRCRSGHASSICMVCRWLHLRRDHDALHLHAIAESRTTKDEDHHRSISVRRLCAAAGAGEGLGDTAAVAPPRRLCDLSAFSPSPHCNLYKSALAPVIIHRMHIKQQVLAGGYKNRVETLRFGGTVSRNPGYPKSRRSSLRQSSPRCPSFYCGATD